MGILVLMYGVDLLVPLQGLILIFILIMITRYVMLEVKFLLRLLFRIVSFLVQRQVRVMVSTRYRRTQEYLHSALVADIDKYECTIQTCSNVNR